jgi:acyl-CoA reductase-like NAD-dependent aldehyde dehydrogenase
MVDEAVQGAVVAQSEWARRSPSERGRILQDISTALDKQVDRLATLIVLDNGKTLREACVDVLGAAHMFRMSAAWALTLESQVLPTQPGLLRLTWREPVGVIGGIIPFNAPGMFAASKAGPALAAGNAIVLKAPDQAPLAAPVVASIARDAGLPAGLFQVLQGGADTGEQVVRNGAVGMITFTGSTRTGRAIMAQAAKRPIPVLLELGGKSANIVYDDADLELSVAGSVAAAFGNAGQRCLAGSVLLLQEGIADRFIERLVEDTESLRVGDPFDPSTQVGSVISSREADRILSVVADAKAEGARIITGGHRPLDTPTDSAFVNPTIVDAGAQDIRLACEEVFGPVLLVRRFGTDAEAINLANRSPFGLVGGCWTARLDRGIAAAQGVQSGMFWINSWGSSGDLPFGGRKDSGFGSEGGHQGHEAYTLLKSVMINTAGAAFAPRYA